MTFRETIMLFLVMGMSSYLFGLYLNAIGYTKMLWGTLMVMGLCLFIAILIISLYILSKEVNHGN